MKNSKESHFGQLWETDLLLSKPKEPFYPMLLKATWVWRTGMCTEWKTCKSQKVAAEDYRLREFWECRAESIAYHCKRNVKRSLLFTHRPVFLPLVTVWVHAKSLQLCLTLCDLMDYSPAGSSVCGILQARIMEWVALPFSKGSSLPRDRTQVSCTAGRFFIVWTTRRAHFSDYPKLNP